MKLTFFNVIFVHESVPPQTGYVLDGIRINKLELDEQISNLFNRKTRKTSDLWLIGDKYHTQDLQFVFDFHENTLCLVQRLVLFHEAVAHEVLAQSLVFFRIERTWRNALDALVFRHVIHKLVVFRCARLLLFDGVAQFAGQFGVVGQHEVAAGRYDRAHAGIA